MGYNTEIGTRLAWRAKWRRRLEKWKTAIVLAMLVLFGAPVLLAFTPWAPQKYYDYVDQNKQDEITGMLRPWAAKRMYQLGIFYGLTMRPKEGSHCYRTIEKWRYGYDLDNWLYGRRPQESDIMEPIKFPEEAEKYVGYAIFRHGVYLMNIRHGAQGRQLFQYYLDEYGSRPDRDEKQVEQAQKLSRTY